MDKSQRAKPSKRNKRRGSSPDAADTSSEGNVHQAKKQASTISAHEVCLNAKADLQELAKKAGNSDSIQQHLNQLDPLIDALKTEELFVVVTGGAGLGKSAMINRIVDPEGSGETPLPSFANPGSVTRDFIEVHNCKAAPPRVLLRFCSPAEYSARIAQRATERLGDYRSLRHGVNFLVLQPEVQGVPMRHRVRDLLLQLDNLRTTEEILATDAVEVHYPTSFALSFVIVDTPGLGHETTKQQRIWRDMYAKCSAIVSVSQRISGQHELTPIFELGACANRDKRVPVLISAYLDGPAPVPSLVPTRPAALPAAAASASAAAEHSSDPTAEFRELIEQTAKSLARPQTLLWPSEDVELRGRLFDQLLSLAMCFNRTRITALEAETFLTKLQGKVHLRLMADIYRSMATFLVAIKPRSTDKHSSARDKIDRMAKFCFDLLSKQWQVADLESELLAGVEESVVGWLSGVKAPLLDDVLAFVNNIRTDFIWRIVSHSVALVANIDKLATINYRERVKGDKKGGRFTKLVGDTSLEEELTEDDREFYQLIQMQRHSLSDKLYSRLKNVGALEDPTVHQELCTAAENLRNLFEYFAADEETASQNQSAGIVSGKLNADTLVTQLRELLQRQVMHPLAAEALKGTQQAIETLKGTLHELHNSINDVADPVELAELIKETRSRWEHAFSSLYFLIHDRVKPPFCTLHGDRNPALGAWRQQDLRAELRKYNAEKDKVVNEKGNGGEQSGDGKPAARRGKPGSAARHWAEFEKNPWPGVQLPVTAVQPPRDTDERWRLIEASWHQERSKVEGVDLRLSAKGRQLIDGFLARLRQLPDVNTKPDERAVMPVFQLTSPGSNGTIDCLCADFMSGKAAGTTPAFDETVVPHLIVWIVEPRDADAYLAIANGRKANVLVLCLPADDLKPEVWCAVMKATAEHFRFPYYWHLTDTIVDCGEIYHELLRSRKCSVPRALWFMQHLLCPLSAQVLSEAREKVKAKLFALLPVFANVDEPERGQGLLQALAQDMQRSHETLEELLRWLQLAKNERIPALKELCNELLEIQRPLKEAAVLTFQHGAVALRQHVSANSAQTYQIIWPNPGGNNSGALYAEVTLHNVIAEEPFSYLREGGLKNFLAAEQPTRKQFREALKDARRKYMRKITKKGRKGLKAFNFLWRHAPQALGRDGPSQEAHTGEGMLE